MAARNMVTIFDVDAYICEKLPSRPGQVARHKLLYGVHRLAIIQTGEPIFDALCAALPLGPVFIDLLENPNKVGDSSVLSANSREIVDRVLDKLGAMSGRSLAARSHRNYYEWRIMREGMRENQVFDHGKYREIPVSLIRRLPQVQRQGARVGNPINL